jgi:hypothetical protein
MLMDNNDNPGIGMIGTSGSFLKDIEDEPGFAKERYINTVNPKKGYDHMSSLEESIIANT